MCARNRDNSSIACGECDPNMRWTSAGPCEICEPSDVSFLLIVIFLGTKSLLSVYCAVVNKNREEQRAHGSLGNARQPTRHGVSDDGRVQASERHVAPALLDNLEPRLCVQFHAGDLERELCGGNVRRDSLRCICFRLRGASGRHVHCSRLAHAPLANSRDDSRTVEAFPTGSRGRPRVHLHDALHLCGGDHKCIVAVRGASEWRVHRGGIPSSSVLVELGAQAHALGGCCGELHSDRIFDHGLHRCEASAKVPRVQATPASCTPSPSCSSGSSQARSGTSRCFSHAARVWRSLL